MDYREYREKYGSNGSRPSSGKDSGNAKNGGSGYSDYRNAVGLESETGSVTRHFVSSGKKKKRRSAASKNSASAKIVIASIIGLTFVLIFVFALCIFVTGSERPDCLAGKLIVEAGRSSISASDFLYDKSHTAEFDGDGNYRLDTIGKYSVYIYVDGDNTRYRVTLEVRDTKAPTANARTLTIRKGRTPKALSCVTDVTDATEVTAAFKEETDFSATGSYPVTVVLTDAAGNTSEVASTVNVVEDADILVSEIEIEAGGNIPDIFEFIGDDGTGRFTETPSSKIDTAVPGTYTLEINVQGKLYPVYVKVVDTVAPTATVIEKDYYNNNIPDALSFFSSVNDATDVTAEYINSPDWVTSGKVTVKIRLTDKGGNSTEYETVANHKYDTTAPTILLLQDYLECELGASVISWSNAVVATDDSGSENVKIVFDKCNADLQVSGSYDVKFTATDEAGNSSTATMRLEVHTMNVTLDMLYEIIGPIVRNEMKITDSMSHVRIAQTIYNWLNESDINKLKYTDDTPHDDWILRSYLALTGDHKGDCFVFAAVAQACFRYLGYDTVMVERTEAMQKTLNLNGVAYGSHWWIMVNYGTEDNPSWYHFDATPQRAPFRGENLYMMTTAQTEAFSKYRTWYIYNKVDGSENVPNWYVYDTSKYPTSATKVIVEFKDSNYNSYLKAVQ